MRKPNNFFSTPLKPLKETAELLAFAEAVPTVRGPIPGLRPGDGGGSSMRQTPAQRNGVVGLPTRRPEMAPQRIWKH